MPSAHCLFCLGRLPPNGNRPVCSDQCDDGWWEIVPTLDGTLYADHDDPDDDEPEPQGPPPYLAQYGMKPARPALERPPEPWEGASIPDQIYLSGSRLHRHLVECNP